MPRKTRFVAFDWLSTPNNAPDRTRSDMPYTSQTSANLYAQSPAIINSTGAPQVPLKVVSNSDDTSAGSLSDGVAVNPLSLSRTSLASSQHPKTPQQGQDEYLQAGFEKVTNTADRSACPEPAKIHSPMHRGLSEGDSLVTLSSARLHQSPYLGPYTSPSLSHDASMARSASSPGLSVRPAHMDKLWPRKPIQEVPVPGKIYFIPDGRYFPTSIIHAQKHQVGFFRHPIMILDVDSSIVNFYAMTKEPPAAIRDLNMAMRLGTSAADEGAAVLRLAPGSDIMLQETWINLEQRFFIEWRNLDEWAVHVRVDPREFSKIAQRVDALEAQQNRFIYKPLLRAMHAIQPGMVIMLPNHAGSATFGAPILVLHNAYPDFAYLRVKRFEDNVHFNPRARRAKASEPRMSLAITSALRLGHDGTPVMLLEPDSPPMREDSYVEVQAHAQVGRLDLCRTWCWPPVCVNQMSMVILRNWMADAALGRLQWQQTAMVMPVYSPANYMYGASNVFQYRGAPGSG